MRNEHGYEISLEWVGNTGTGTSDVRGYGRQQVLRAAGKHDVLGSADTPFRGDADRWNPEELLLAALAECHSLTYLWLAARNGIVVEQYLDRASGTIEVLADASGRFTEAVLRPEVVISAGDEELALRLHVEAGEKCFISASLAFPVRHEPSIRRS